MSIGLQPSFGSSLLRIACFGFAERDAGSISSAGSFVAEGLLDRGHTIDFFGKSSFFRPKELEVYPNFRFIEVREPRAEALATRLRKWKSGSLAYIASQVAHAEFKASILQEMRARNTAQRYDVQLWLGDWAWERLGSMPVVSWVQGPPQTDAKSISRRKVELIRLCGWKTYIPMRLFAVYRGTFGLPPFANSDVVVVGSEWSRARLVTYGLSPDRIKAIGYPMDLNRFAPVFERVSPNAVPLILWLGRTVPRKRLDLFLDACEILLNQGLNFRAMVVGGFGRFEGYKQLVDDFQRKHPGNLEYIARVDRDSVVTLLHSAAVLVQPSEEEDFGSSVGEALACGTPVVVGPSNGTADYIGDGGVRFELYEPSSVANAITAAMSGGSKRRTAAREAAEESFSIHRVTDKMESVLRTVLTEHGVTAMANG